MSTRRILIGTFSSLLALATSLSALAQTTLYWDINGPTPGAGQDQDGFTDGLWGTDAFWSTDPTGSSATGPWTPGSHAVFSAGNYAGPSYIDTVPPPHGAAVPHPQPPAPHSPPLNSHPRGALPCGDAVGG